MCKLTECAVIDDSLFYRLNRELVALCHNVAMRLGLVSLFCLRAWAADNMPPEAEQRLPDDSVERVVAELTKLIADDQVKITITVSEGTSPASPMRPDIMKPFGRITDTMWPGVITVPTMAVGGSDGRYLRVAGIPTYGIQGFFQDRDDVRAHGRDERMPIRSFYEGQTFLYEFVKALSQ